MSAMPRQPVGTILWTDLTIPNAGQARDFYQQVIGWEPADVPVDDYNDYMMNIPGSETPAAGVCHQRGQNAGLPSQWLIYIAVENLDQSLDAVERLGGNRIAGPTVMGADRFCVIQDPAGAVCALYEQGVSAPE